MLAALFAAYLAAAPLDAPHAALLDVLTRENDSMAACGAAKLQKISASATVKKLGRAGADEVVLAEVFDPCICGAQNCPLYVLRLGPGKPRVLLTAFSIGVKLKPAAQLPTLIVRSHDSAAISGEETYTYRNGGYALTGSARVRGDNERKTAQEVRFVPGASSANLRGSVSTGWYDEYVFAATKGQKLLVDGVRSNAKLTLTLYGPANSSADVRAGAPFTLPASGTYHLHVDNDSAETNVPYSLNVAIR